MKSWSQPLYHNDLSRRYIQVAAVEQQAFALHVGHSAVTDSLLPIGLGKQFLLPRHRHSRSKLRKYMKTVQLPLELISTGSLVSLFLALAYQNHSRKKNPISYLPTEKGNFYLKLVYRQENKNKIK